MRSPLHEPLARLFPSQSTSAGRAAGWLRLLGLWVALAVASITGLLAPVNGWLFDLMVRVPPLERLEPQVALVAVGPDEPGTGAVDPDGLARRLRVAGAIAVVGLPDIDARDDALAASLARREGTCRPVPTQGVLRTLQTRDDTGEPCPAVAIAALLGASLPVTDRISPALAIETSTAVPRLDGGDLDSSLLVQEAVAGRVVLLTRDAEPTAYVTPLYPADGLLDLAVFQALAVDSMLKGEAVQWAPRGADVLLALLVAALLRFALRYQRYRATLACLALSVIPVLLLGLLLIRWAEFRIPVTATLLSIAAYALRTVLRRNRVLGDTLVDLDHRLTGLVQQPLNRPFVQERELTWEQINHFVAQFFDLRRSVMLELPPGATHLRAVSTLGCKAQDIVEKRRDYRRAPFSTAATREKPMRVPAERPFLRPGTGLVDFLAPLVAADQLVGFWGFSVAVHEQTEIDLLVQEAERYAEELAKVILRSGNPPPPTDDLDHNRRLPLAQTRARLFDAAARAREQLAAYRDVFSAVGHPTAVADLLGRIQFANPRFEQLATAVSQPLLAMSVGDMLEQLCGLPSAEAKDVLRRIVLQAGLDTTELPIHHLDTPIEHSLFLHPIRRQAGRQTAAGVPFDLLGIIVEISPTAAASDSSGRMSVLASRYLRSTHDLLESLMRAVDRLPADAPGRDVLLDPLAKGLDDARRMERLLATGSGSGSGQPATVNLPRLLYRARHEIIGGAALKGIEFELADSGPRSVHAPAGELRALLVSVLDLLVDDAAPNTRITLESRHSDDGLAAVVTVSNEGYGLPAAHVAEAIRAGAHQAIGDDASPLDRVARAAHRLDASIAFNLSSDLGSGYTMRLTIPREPPFIA